MLVFPLLGQYVSGGCEREVVFSVTQGRYLPVVAEMFADDHPVVAEVFADDH